MTAGRQRLSAISAADSSSAIKGTRTPSKVHRLRLQSPFERSAIIITSGKIALRIVNDERKAKLNSSFVHLNEDAPIQSSVRCPTCGLMIPSTMKSCPQDGTEMAQVILGGGLSANYEFIEAFGSGGMSVIYKARHRALDRIVAIKMLHGHMLTDTIVRRFQQEAKASSLLRHPNTVDVYDFGVTENGQPFMVMDFVEGETLTARLKRQGTLPPQDCIKIFKQVCDAVEHAHELGILHRDLKPGNIMLIESEGTPGIVKILDFGIAKIMDATDSPGHNLTQTGEVFGSPLYMSPEQCAGSKELDRRSDIYSLGCVMYEALTGTVPHRGDTVMTTILKQVNERPRSISELQPNAHIPAKLEDIVEKSLEKNPDKRFQSMEELKEALVELRDNQNLDTAGGGKRWKHLTRKIQIPKNALWLLLVGVLAVTAVYAFLRPSAPKPNPPEPSQLPTDSSPFPPDSISSRQTKFEHDFRLFDRSKITDQILSEYLPVDIKIEKLDLRGSSVTDRGLMFVGKQSRLQQLNLGQTQITDTGLSFLRDLKGLQTLGLDSTTITDEGLTNLRQMTDMTGLSLVFTKISNAGLANLQAMKHLDRLLLTGTPINGQGLQLIEQLPIEQLHVDRTMITDDDFTVINKFKSLTLIHIGASRLTGEGFQHLTDLKSLKQIFMSNCLVEDKNLHFLKQLPMLEDVAAGTTRITDAGVPILTELPNLKRIQLSQDNITDVGLECLTKVAQLERLNIEKTHVTDKGFRNISRLINLHELYAGGTDISDTSLESLTSMTNLDKLGIDRTRVTDKGFHNISKLTKLQDLNVGGTDITDASLTEIAKLPDLRKLNIKLCHRITTAAVDAFRAKQLKCHVEI